MRSTVQQEMTEKNMMPPHQDRMLDVGQPVQIRFYNNATCKWKFDTVVCQLGGLHYALLVDGIEHTRHVNQFRSTTAEFSNNGRATARVRAER
jgi:hypothetical protein